MSDTNTGEDLTRAQKLDLIYQHTHPDYRGIAGERWGSLAGKRTILIGSERGSALVLLEELNDTDLAAKLPYALRCEARRQKFMKKIIESRELEPC